MTFNPQPKPERREPKPRKPLNKKRKATGEREIFLEIWNERKHFCVDCNKFLGHEAKTWFFSHEKPKSTYPELRLDKTNIFLRCLACHDKKDNG